MGHYIKDATPHVRKTIQSWLGSSQSGRPQARSPADDEIHPETTEVEVFPVPEMHTYPTAARVRQKEKHKHFKEVTGEKHQPVKRKQRIHPGKDYCGEDFSSMGNLSASTTYDTCTTAEEHVEFQLDLGRSTESFLLSVEASFSPHHHFFGGEIPRSVYQHTVEMPTLGDAMAFLAKHSSKQQHNVVEMCGGTSRVSQILISRR